MDRADGLFLCVLIFREYMWDLNLLEFTAIVILLQIPQMSDEAVSCRRKQAMFGVELREVNLSVLTCLPQVDAELCIVLKRLHSCYDSSSVWTAVGVLLEVRVTRMEACRHEAHLGCGRGCPRHLLLLLLVVRMLQEVSLLRRIVSKLTHHAGHFVSRLHLVALGYLHRLTL